jgi:hypothetical protein
MRTLLLSFLLCASALVQANHGPVDVQIIDRETGQTLPLHAQAGQEWIAGSPGHRYAVRLTNRSAQRVLAVLSIDGVNAVSGETASPQQTGYVLAPWQSTQIDGWRKSLSDVAAFEFTSLSSSYAARTGRPDNVGVIGVAVFRERMAPYQPPMDEIARQETPSAAGAMRERRQADSSYGVGDQAKSRSPLASAPQESLGTGHGERETSLARHVAFQRDSQHPAQVRAIRYDSHANLVAMGVIRPHHLHRHGAPDPFPIGFVADPD